MMDREGGNSMRLLNVSSFSATAKEIPEVLFEQLAEGGILIAPVEETENYHIITRYYKKNGRITSETIEQCLFVPILDGTQK